MFGQTGAPHRKQCNVSWLVGTSLWRVATF